MLLRLLAAFLAGGTLCALLQIAVDRTALTPARILTGTVVAGVILSGLGLYGPFAAFAHCGATVPLSGFGHLIAEGVREEIDRAGAVGILTGGLKAAAGGIAAAVLFGYSAALLGRARTKF